MKYFILVLSFALLSLLSFGQTKAEIENEIETYIENVYGSNSYNSEYAFVSDYGYDDWDLMILVCKFETKYYISISDDCMDELVTCQDLIDIIYTITN